MKRKPQSRVKATADLSSGDPIGNCDDTLFQGAALNLDSKYLPKPLKNYVSEISTRNREDSGHPVYSVTNSAGFVPSEDYFNKQVFSKDTAKYKIVPPGGFAYNPSRINVGSIDYLRQDSPVLVSPLYIVFRTSPDLHPSYLKWFLLSEAGMSQIDHHTQGAVRDSLKFSGLQKIKIPFPPLDAQRRIAALLDRADALRRQCQEFLKLTEKFLQSIFLDMFVKNLEAENWPHKTIEWMAKEGKGAIRTGPFGSQLLHSEFVDSGIAVLGIDNAVQNRFEWGQLRFITPEKYQNLKRYKVFSGDLIVTIMGTLGRCAIVPEEIPEAINTKHLCCITLDRKKCHPEFLHACLLHHPDVLRQLGVRTKGAVMPGLNMGIIKALELPLPPLGLQEKFKRIVAATTRVRIDTEESQRSLENLFGAIQQRAFRGELDLSHFKIDDEIKISEQSTAPESMTIEGKYKRPGCFTAPSDIEAQLMMLEDQLEYGHDDFIPWSEDYFKYRTLSQVLDPPFSFSEIKEEVYNDMPEASYETIKTKIFEYLAEGILEQRFDEVRQEIVFYPRP